MKAKLSEQEMIKLARLYQHFMFDRTAIPQVLRAYPDDEDLCEAIRRLNRKFGTDLVMSSEELSLVEAYASLVQRFVHARFNALLPLVDMHHKRVHER